MAHASKSVSSCVLAAVAFACTGPPDVVATQKNGAVEVLEPTSLTLSGDLELFDPSAIFDRDRYWVVSTGGGMPVRVSTDLKQFQLLGDAVPGLPAWAAQHVPRATHYWSPDVAYFGGRYHLYYALASGGAQTACIGHATSSKLGTVGTWTDDGVPLICTQDNDEWVAIDPSVLVEDDGKAWLLAGSTPGAGLKLLELDASGGRTAAEPTPIAGRPGGGVIQASAITRHGNYYYVFTSFDLCCRGVDSTRSIRFGRSSALLGPYLDRDSVPLLNGGGSVLLEGGARWKGPGSNDVLRQGEQSYSFYFAYDADNGGKTSLRLSTLTWDEQGWPRSAGP